MAPTKQTYNAAVRFAKANGFDGVTFSAEYKRGVAYHANSKALEGGRCGFPHFVIVYNGLKCRYSTPDEALEIIERNSH